MNNQVHIYFVYFLSDSTIITYYIFEKEIYIYIYISPRYKFIILKNELFVYFTIVSLVRKIL